jgi:hypothetical protein
MDAAGIAEGEFGVGAGDGLIGVNAIAGLKSFDAVADGFNGAGGIVAGRGRKFLRAVASG